MRQDIIALPAHHLPGRDLNRIVGAVLGSNAPPFQLYVNELLPDVEYQGEPCNVVVYVQESTDTQGEAALEGPRPIFPRLQTFPILCDARQVGRGLSVMPAADVLVTDHDVLAFLGLPGAGSPFRVRHLPHDQHPALESSLRCVQVFEEQGMFASPGTHWRAASGPTLPQLLYQDAGHQDPGPPGADTDGGASPGGLSCASSPAEADVDDHSGNLTDTESEAAVFEAAFLVFRIGYTPLLVQLSLSVQVTVADAIDAVRTALDSHVRAAFPLLLPVLPQLSDAWGSVLALPSWAIDESVVVLDMRQYDGRFFPAALPPVFNQGHVCRAARLPEDGSFQVFPFGADLHLLGADEVEVRPGGSVTIVPTGRRPSNRGYLPAMLADPQGWTPAHMLPSGPGGLRSHYVCLVFETGCRLHFLDSPPGTHVAAIALCYGLQEHLTTAQATSPRVLDVSLEGYACRGVAAVSGDLTSIPIPPGRLRTGVFLTVVDCRPILQGWHLLFVTDGTYPLDELLDLFSVFVPDGYRPLITGAPLVGGRFQLRPGLVLTAQFVLLESETDEDDACSHSNGRLEEVAGMRGAQSGADGSPSRSRSRTPPRHARDGAVTDAVTDAVLPDAFAPHAGALVAVQKEYARLSFGAHFLPSPFGRKDIDSALSGVGEADRRLFCGCSGPFLRGYSRRDGSNDHVVSLALDFLPRYRTCRMPAPSPHGSAPVINQSPEQRLLAALQATQRGPGLPPPVLEVPRPDQAPALLLQGTPFQAVFLVFVQDYQPELIEVELSAPCSFDTAMAAVSRQRGQRAAFDFPVLIPAHPQTLSGIGMLLALPDWEFAGVPVLFDCAELDGRYFAVVVSEVVDRASLLTIAEVPATVPVFVYFGDMPWPLEPRQPVRPQEGDVITIIPIDHRPLVLMTLPDMLLSAVGWLTVQAIPGAFDRSLWILTEVEPLRVAADPGRRAQWRHDIAALLRCRPHAMRLQPPRPGVLNHADRGHLTASVLVALPEQAGPTQLARFLCFLDLRALYIGVTWQYAPRGLFDQGAFVRQLAGSIPIGYVLVFRMQEQDVDPQAMLVLVENGALLTASLRPSAAQAVPAGDDTPPRDVGPDGPDAGTGDTDSSDDPAEPETEPMQGTAGAPVMPHMPRPPAWNATGYAAKWQRRLPRRGNAVDGVLSAAAWPRRTNSRPPRSAVAGLAEHSARMSSTDGHSAGELGHSAPLYRAHREGVVTAWHCPGMWFVFRGLVGFIVVQQGGAVQLPIASATVASADTGRVDMWIPSFFRDGCPGSHSGPTPVLPALTAAAACEGGASKVLPTPCRASVPLHLPQVYDIASDSESDVGFDDLGEWSAFLGCTLLEEALAAADSFTLMGGGHPS